MANLAVTICVSPNNDECSAQVSGSTQHLITDAEKKLFHATDSELKTQIEAWSREKCDGAWSTDPTNDAQYPDLHHHHFNWDEVKVNLDAVSATILDFESKREVIGVQDFTNTLSEDMTCKCELKKEVTSTVENTWSSSDSLGVGQEIKYEIGLLGTGGGGKTSINYTHEWGEEKKESKSYTLGLTQAVEFILPPRKSAKAELTASKETLKIEIKYRATLQGLIAAFFHKNYHDRQKWAFYINGIKQNLHLNTDFDYSEIIEIGFFSNPKVDVKINENNPLLILIPSENSPFEDDREVLLEQMFEKFAKGKNGLITKDEFEASLRCFYGPSDPPLLDLLFQVLGGRDGRLSRQEYFQAFKLFIDSSLRQHTP